MLQYDTRGHLYRLRGVYVLPSQVSDVHRSLIRPNNERAVLWTTQMSFHADMSRLIRYLDMAWHIATGGNRSNRRLY